MVNDTLCQSLLTGERDNTHMSTFADRLAGAMRLAGYDNNAELARKVGCSRQAIHNWRNGKPFNEADTLFALARELNVSARWLLLNEGLPSQKPALSDDEALMLLYFRRMTDEQRASMLTLARGMQS